MTERFSGHNHQGRRVLLASHGPDVDVSVRASVPTHHASIGFDGFWKSASVAMTLGELAEVRDAINAVLVEAGRG